MRLIRTSFKLFSIDPSCSELSHSLSHSSFRIFFLRSKKTINFTFFFVFCLLFSYLSLYNNLKCSRIFYLFVYLNFLVFPLVVLWVESLECDVHVVPFSQSGTSPRHHLTPHSLRIDIRELIRLFLLVPEVVIARLTEQRLARTCVKEYVVYKPAEVSTSRKCVSVI